MSVESNSAANNFIVIENMLGRSVSKSLRDFLLRNEGAYIGGEATIDDPTASEDITFLTDIVNIESANSPFFYISGHTYLRDELLFPFGSDICGNIFVENSDGEVLFLQLGSFVHPAIKVSSSFDDLCRGLKWDREE